MEKLSVKQLYQHFLTEIRKDYTGTVIPQVWNTIMRDALQEWKAKLAKELDFGVYAMAEQSGLRITTDGTSADYLQIKLAASDIPGVFIMNNPKEQDGTNEVTLDTNQDGKSYPTMFRRLSIRAGYLMTTPGESDPDAIKCEIPCHELAGFEANDVFSNHYRRPSLRKCYYGMGATWKFYTPENVLGLYLVLDYISEPLELYFDATSPADMDPIVPADLYQAGKGSVNTNLSEGVKRELVNIAAKNFLKNVGDPRYQMYLQEQQLRIKG